MQGGLALVPRLGSDLEPSRWAPYSRTRTTTRTITRTTPITTQPIIHRRHIIHPRVAAGIPITVTITLADSRLRPGLREHRGRFTEARTTRFLRLLSRLEIVLD